MNADDHRRLTPIFGIIAAALAALLIALWAGAGRSPNWHDGAAPSRLPTVVSNLPLPTIAPLRHYREVWLRPLFSPTRSPGSTTEAKGDFQLTGVIMSPGLDMAILHDKTSGKDYRVIKGRPTEGAPVLVDLSPRGAIVDASGSRLQLKLIPGPSPDSKGTSSVNGLGTTATGIHALQVESAGSTAAPMVLRRAGPDPLQVRMSEPASNLTMVHVNARAARANKARGQRSY